jgi:hypothetical protein
MNHDCEKVKLMLEKRLGEKIQGCEVEGEATSEGEGEGVKDHTKITLVHGHCSSRVDVGGTSETLKCPTRAHEGEVDMRIWTPCLQLTPMHKVAKRCMRGVKCVNAHCVGGKGAKKGGVVTRARGYVCKLCGFTCDCIPCMQHECISTLKRGPSTTHVTMQHIVSGLSAFDALNQYGCEGFFKEGRGPVVFVLPSIPTEWDTKHWSSHAITLTQDFIVLVDGRVVLSKINDACPLGMQSSLLDVVRRGYWLGGKVRRGASVGPEHAHTTCWGMRLPKGGATVLGSYHQTVAHPRESVPHDLQPMWAEVRRDPGLLSSLGVDMETNTTRWYQEVKKFMSGPFNNEELVVAKMPGVKGTYGVSFATACVTTHNYVSNPHVDQTDCGLTCTLYLEEGDSFKGHTAKQKFSLPSLGVCVEVTNGCVIAWDPQVLHLTEPITNALGDVLHPMQVGGSVLHPSRCLYTPNEEVKARMYGWTMIQKPMLLEKVCSMWAEDEDTRRAHSLNKYQQSRVVKKVKR